MVLGMLTLLTCIVSTTDVHAIKLAKLLLEQRNWIWGNPYSPLKRSLDNTLQIFTAAPLSKQVGDLQPNEVIRSVESLLEKISSHHDREMANKILEYLNKNIEPTSASEHVETVTSIIDYMTYLHLRYGKSNPLLAYPPRSLRNKKMLINFSQNPEVLVKGSDHSLKKHDSEQYRIFLDHFFSENQSRKDVVDSRGLLDHNLARKAYKLMLERNKESLMGLNYGPENQAISIALDLKFIESDFIRTFGEVNLKNDAWGKKINTWYKIDNPHHGDHQGNKLVWRGYTPQQNVHNAHYIEVLHPALTRFFESFSPNNNIHSHGPLNAVAKLAKYNHDLYNDGPVGIFKKFYGRDPGQEKSYYHSPPPGFLASLEREVAKDTNAFEKRIQNFIQNSNPRHLHSNPPDYSDLSHFGRRTSYHRYILGFKMGKKDIPIHNSTLEGYPLHEMPEVSPFDVLVIGALEPDAVMVVQKLDIFGDVVQSFVRSNDNPSKIFVYNNDITFVGDTQGLPEKIISLDELF